MCPPALLCPSANLFVLRDRVRRVAKDADLAVAEKAPPDRCSVFVGRRSASDWTCCAAALAADVPHRGRMSNSAIAPRAVMSLLIERLA